MANDNGNRLKLAFTVKESPGFDRIRAIKESKQRRRELLDKMWAALKSRKPQESPLAKQFEELTGQKLTVEALTVEQAALEGELKGNFYYYYNLFSQFMADHEIEVHPDILPLIVDGVLEHTTTEGSLLMLDSLLRGNDVDCSRLLDNEEIEIPYGKAPYSLNILSSTIKVALASQSLDNCCQILGNVLGTEMEHGLPEEVYITLFDCGCMDEVNYLGGRKMGDLKLAYFYKEFTDELRKTLWGSDDAYLAASMVGSRGSGELITVSFGAKALGPVMYEAEKTMLSRVRGFLKTFRFPDGSKIDDTTASHLMENFFSVREHSSFVGIRGKAPQEIANALKGAIRECREGIESASFHIPIENGGNGWGEALSSLTREKEQQFHETEAALSYGMSPVKDRYLLVVKHVYEIGGDMQRIFINRAHERGKWMVSGQIGVVRLRALRLLCDHKAVNGFVYLFLSAPGNNRGFVRLGSSGAIFRYLSRERMMEDVRRLSERAKEIEQDLKSVSTGTIRPLFIACPVRSETAADVGDDIDEAIHSIQMPNLLPVLYGGDAKRDGNLILVTRKSISQVAPAVRILLSRVSNFAHRAGGLGRSRNPLLQRNLGAREAPANPMIEEFSRSMLEGHPDILQELEGRGRPKDPYAEAKLIAELVYGEGATSIVTLFEAERAKNGQVRGNNIFVPEVADSVVAEFVAKTKGAIGLDLVEILKQVPSNHDPYEVVALIRRFGLKRYGGAMETFMKLFETMLIKTAKRHLVDLTKSRRN
ncbi:MAG: hypothetical protein ABII71_00890 [Candidatus Micrarchaeota archaeon]